MPVQYSAQDAEWKIYWMSTKNWYWMRRKKLMSSSGFFLAVSMQRREQKFLPPSTVIFRDLHWLMWMHHPRRYLGVKLASLKVTSSPGPDAIHPKVLHEAVGALSRSLSLLYRRSLDPGQLPAEWKIGHVISIHKKGDRRNPPNYRPVSLTAVPSKVLELIIWDQVSLHWEWTSGFCTGCISSKKVMLKSNFRGDQRLECHTERGCSCRCHISGLCKGFWLCTTPAPP